MVHLHYTSAKHVFQSNPPPFINIALFAWTEQHIYVTGTIRDHECLSEIFSPGGNVCRVCWMVLIMKQSVTHIAGFLVKPCKHPVIYQTTFKICFASHQYPNPFLVLFFWKCICDLLWCLNYRVICLLLYPWAVIDCFVALFIPGTFFCWVFAVAIWNCLPWF